MKRVVAIACVEFGTPRPAWCDGCQTSARNEYELVGLTDEGPVTLGIVAACVTCDPDAVDHRFHCRQCNGGSPASPDALLDHLRGHGEGVG